MPKFKNKTPYTIIFLGILKLTLISQAAIAKDHNYYTNTSKEALGCVIGTALKSTLLSENQTWASKREEMISRLKTFAPFAGAFTKYQTGPAILTKMFISNLTFLSDGAYLDPNVLDQLSKDDYLTANWYRIIEERLRKETITDKVYSPNELKEMLIPYLDIVRPLDTPDVRLFRFENKITHEMSTLDNEHYGWFLEHSLDTRKGVFKQIKQMNLIAGPLYLWLLEQKQESVSHIKVFEQALKIYKDPFIALGSISWLLAFESQFPDRDNTALASKALEPILFRVSDHVGSVYHFWGYVTRALLSYPDSPSYLSFRSKIYEGIHQKDGQDLAADHFGIEVADTITKVLSNKMNCH